MIDLGAPGGVPYVGCPVFPFGIGGTNPHVNNHGQVVIMTWCDRSGIGIPPVPCSFLWQDGTLTDLGAQPYGMIALAINARGQIVGQYEDAEGKAHPFLWEKGTLSDLGVGGSPARPPRLGCGATAINDRGQVVGWCYTDDYHASIWEESAVMDIGPPGVCSQALTINERGQVVYYICSGPDRNHIALWENGAATDLGILADTEP